MCLLIVDLVVDRQFDVQLTQAERERKNERELTYGICGSIVCELVFKS